MGDKTGIEWTDATWNPTTGCDRVSPGCDNCYALTQAKRLKLMGSARYQTDGDPRTSGPGFGLTVHPDALDLPFRWKKPRKVFVNSMSDLFHPDVPDGFIGTVLDVTLNAPQHTYQVLTKRPQRMASFLLKCRTLDGASWFLDEERRGEQMVFPSLWLGTSIESDRYTFRADHVRATPAAVRWLSLEPLLGPLPSLDLTGIDWVVLGGESGPGARPMHPDWARDIRERCCTARVPLLVKQWGEWKPVSVGATHRVARDGSWYPNPATCVMSGEELIARVGKKAAGRELDGVTWDQYPEVAR